MTRNFWIIATLFLLWNLAGDAAYLMQATQDLDVLARTDPVGAEAFRTMPTWAWSAYAVAVWGGTAGAIALLLRRKIAITLFAVSLVAVLVQFGWTFLGTDLIAKKGFGAAAFPLLIALICLVEIAWARRQAKADLLR